MGSNVAHGMPDPLIDPRGRAVPIKVLPDGTVVTTTDASPLIPTSTGTPSSTPDSTSSTTLLASNADRRGATIFNDSTADLYLALFSPASTTSFTAKLVSGAYYEVPYGYTGIITGIWSSDAGGSARVVEFE